MLAKTKKKDRDNVATMVLSHIRNYGENNPEGNVFDEVFNQGDTLNEINNSRHLVGQGVQQMMYPNGISPDGYSTFMPAIMMKEGIIDPEKVQDSIAENQVQLYWRNNVERTLKYNIIATRSEVNEALTQICNEAIYMDDIGEICSLEINEYSQIGDTTKESLHTIFQRDVLRRIFKLQKNGWNYMKKLLIEGRLFLEVAYDKEKNVITGVNMLPSQNMIVVVQNNLIIGYRQMLDGGYSQNGKNYIDFSPNQILFLSLDLYGPGGVNDPRSILEPAMKPHNQLNTIEDSVVMYRILWGSEKMCLKVDVTGMPKPQAEKQMKDQAKIFSRKIDYNTTTGEITNYGRAIGLSEHFVIPVTGSSGSNIERIAGGEQLGNIDDLKFFKRNLVNSLMVPPGRITALAGDANNYTAGKIGEVTQAEVAFARMIQRYRMPLANALVRLFIMVLNTKNEYNDSIKLEENFDVKFKMSNGFQNYIDADVWTTRLGVFSQMMQSAISDAAPNNPLSQKFCMKYGLRLSDEDMNTNEVWRRTEEKRLTGEDTSASDMSAGMTDSSGGIGQF